MRKASTRTMATLVIATLLAVLSLVILAVSFATNHWVEVNVNRDELTTFGIMTAEESTNEAYYFNRDRGMFRTCYRPADQATFLDEWDDVVDGNCQLERGYEVKNLPETDNWGDDYEARIHLLRCHFAFFALAILFILSACFTMGLAGCWRVRVRLYLTATICMLVAALFTMGGMIIFHVYFDMERNDIDTPGAGFPAYWRNIDKLKSALKYFDTSYGYSYNMGWVSMAISIVAFILFAAVTYNLWSSKKTESLDQALITTTTAKVYEQPTTILRPVVSLPVAPRSPKREVVRVTGWSNQPALLQARRGRSAPAQRGAAVAIPWGRSKQPQQLQLGRDGMVPLHRYI